jgi:hypothetical protein
MLATLKTLDPRLFYLLVAGLCFMLIWAWRRFHFSSWEAVTRHNPVLERLPALILSGLLSAAPAIGKDTWSVITEIVMGIVLGGGGATVGHHLLKAAPNKIIPYQGGAKPKDGDPPPPTLPPGPPAMVG